MAAQNLSNEVASASGLKGERGQAGEPEPSPVDGWLFLVMLQNAVALIASVIDGYHIFGGLFSPRLAGAALFALFVSGIAIALNVSALLSMFGRSRWFPSIFVVALLWRICKNAIEIGIMNKVAPHEFINAAPLTASIVWALIWIPYVVRSKRLKNTFYAERNAPANHA